MSGGRFCRFCHVLRSALLGDLRYPGLGGLVVLVQQPGPDFRLFNGPDTLGHSELRKVFVHQHKPDADAPEEPEPAGQGAKGPKGKKDKDETWECNTDKVDREIEKLKKKQQELEQRLNTETDEVKIKDLERQLSQVEQELKQKDNDTYRKQNATYTRLS